MKKLTNKEIEEAALAAIKKGILKETILTLNLWNPYYKSYSFTGTIDDIERRLLQDRIIFGSSGIENTKEKE